MSFIKHFLKRTFSRTSNPQVPAEEPQLRRRRRDRLNENELEDQLAMIEHLVQQYEQWERQTVESKSFSIINTAHSLSMAPIVSDQLSLPSELTQFTDKLMPWQLLTLSDVWPNSKIKLLIENFDEQKFLWLCPVGNQRFPAHEDCCSLCDHVLDVNKFCGRLRSHTYLQILLDANAFSKTSFQSMKCLRLFRFNIDNEIIERLGRMFPNLTHLDLTECRISASSLMATCFAKLEHLILTSTGIDGTKLADMVTFRCIIDNKLFSQPRPYLKTVAVNGTNIQVKDLFGLPKTIERLDIRCCPRLGTTGWSDFFKSGLNQLKVLRIELLLSDVELNAMCNYLKSLNILELYITEDKPEHRFTDVGLANIANLIELTTLKFVGHWNLITIPLKPIVVGCKEVSSFTLDNTNRTPIEEENLSSDDLEFMTKNWLKLEKLELKNIDSVNNAVINGLNLDEMDVKRASSLRYLDLSQCSRVDDKALITNIASFQELRYLILDRCHRVTKKTYTAVVNKAKAIAPNIFTAQFIRCKLYLDNMKGNELPSNLRITVSSVLSKKYRTFDGAFVRDFYYEILHQLME